MYERSSSEWSIAACCGVRATASSASGGISVIRIGTPVRATRSDPVGSLESSGYSSSRRRRRAIFPGSTWAIVSERNCAVVTEEVDRAPIGDARDHEIGQLANRFVVAQGPGQELGRVAQESLLVARPPVAMGVFDVGGRPDPADDAPIW